MVAKNICYISALSRFNGKLRQIATPANVNNLLKTFISNKVVEIFPMRFQEIMDMDLFLQAISLLFLHKTLDCWKQ